MAIVSSGAFALLSWSQMSITEGERGSCNAIEEGDK